MQIFKDSYACTDENRIMKMALFSTVGQREEQQDSAGYELKDGEGMVVICDGMGGHEGGRFASALAVETLLNGYLETYPVEKIDEMLLEATIKADELIFGLKHEDGSDMQCGTTLVAVAIRENQLYWISAGDSHVYLVRNSEMVQVTEDHIYQKRLDEMLREGRMEMEEYESESDERGEALVSFLGVGNISELDRNEVPFPLQKGDKVCLCTDGLYKFLPEDEIASVIMNFASIEETLRALEQKVSRESKKREMSRDNMTVALIQI